MSQQKTVGIKITEDSCIHITPRSGDLGPGVLLCWNRSDGKSQVSTSIALSERAAMATATAIYNYFSDTPEQTV